jgi:hypothetical protein
VGRRYATVVMTGRVQHILELASELSDAERDELLDKLAPVLDIDDEAQRAELRSRADRVLRGESNGRALSEAELAEAFGVRPPRG